MSASLGRQITYTTTRVAIYEVLKQNLTKKLNKEPGFMYKVGISICGGAIGGLVGTPCDMINVRMQNDLKLPKEKRRK